jgi:hypothetical protein
MPTPFRSSELRLAQGLAGSEEIGKRHRSQLSLPELDEEHPDQLVLGDEAMGPVIFLVLTDRHVVEEEDPTRLQELE